MKEIITYKGYIRDLLNLKNLNEEYKIITYNSEKHKKKLMDLHEEIFQGESLELNWDKVENFYEKGIFIVKNKEEYIAFIIVYLIKGKIYLAKFGVKEKYTNKAIAKTLIVEVAKHFNNLSYEKIYVEVNDNTLEDFFIKLGFKKIDFLAF